MTVTLQKMSPLHHVYENNRAHFTNIQGWVIPEHCGNLEKEKAQLEEGCLLVDWSHIGKITLRGKDAAVAVSKVDSRAASLKPLQSCATEEMAILCLTREQFLILCQPDQQATLLASGQAPNTDTFAHGGGLGCLVLAGNRRDEVIERSSAMNLRRDLVPAGSVVQTTVHAIQCTIYRTPALDILVHSRDFSDSLFEALMDVGHRVGLIPSGVATVPVALL